MKTKIQAKPQTLRGDDGHDTFSIRIKHSLTVKLNDPNLSTFLPPHLFALLPALIRRVSPKGCSI